MKLLALDLQESFCANSPGQLAGRIVNRWGEKRLGGKVWEAGLEALVALQEKIAVHDEQEELKRVEELLPEMVRDGIVCLDEYFYPSILVMRNEGLLDLRPARSLGKDGDVDFEEIWSKYEFADKVELFATLVGSMGHVLYEDSEFIPIVRSLSAAAVLIRIDQALLADFFDSSDLSDLVAAIEGLRPHLDRPANTFSKIEVVKSQARIEVSRAAADARHAENRSMKRDAFKWLDTNFKDFKSMDAAASEMASRVVPVAWRTARDWVGEWKKFRSASTT